MLGERIEERRKALGLSRAQLAESLNVGMNTVFRWEKGERSPSDEDKRRLADKLETSVAYLLGEAEDPVFLAPNALSTPKTSLLKHHKPLRAKKSPPAAEGHLYLPLIEHGNCTGKGFGVNDVFEHLSDWISWPIAEMGGPVEPSSPFFVTVEGDSMIGVGIDDGSLALVNPNVEIQNGNPAYIRWNGRCTIKGVIFGNSEKGIELRPANPNFIAARIEDPERVDFEILGKVVYAVKRNIPRDVI